MLNVVAKIAGSLPQIHKAIHCVDQEKVQALMESIQKIGLKEPVSLLPVQLQ